MPSIRVSDLGKRYVVYSQPADRMKELLFRKKRHIEKWALRHLYFDAQPGAVLGVIGQNGSGKSTLARLLAGISEPTEGEVSVAGRVAAVLELGSGFHPDFTGRHNVVMSASFHGLSRSETEAMLPRIIDFSELGDAIDHPVRSYSTGMFLRLGFSLAIHVDADVLIFDEVLAVGDEYFRGKCFNRINRLHQEGKTIVFISHDMSAIRNLCSSVILLDDGRILRQGSPEEVAVDYIERMRARLEGRHAARDAGKDQLRWGSGRVEILCVSLQDADGRDSQVFRTGDRMTIQAEYRVKEDVRNPVFGNGIFRSDGTYVSGFNHLWHRDHQSIDLLRAGHAGRVRCTLPSLPLLPGEYFISYYCYDHSVPAPQPLDHIENALRFSVLPGPFEEHGTVHVDSEWSVET